MRLGDVVKINAAKTPNKLAVIDGPTGRSLTFGQLGDRVNRLSSALVGVGQDGDRVAILCENLPEFVECYFGVPSAGMALTMLNYRLNPKEWAWILDDAGVEVIIVQEKFVPALTAVLDELPDLNLLIVIGQIADADETAGTGSGCIEMRPDAHQTHDAHLTIEYEDFINSGDPEPLNLEIDEDSTAWLLYTSGTTGFPKGAMLSHRNLITGALQSVIEYGPSSNERMLMAFPLCHVAGYLLTVNMLRGGLVVVVPSFDPESWMHTVQDHKITSSGLAPTMFGAILNHEMVDEYDLSSVSSLLYGASAMPVELLRRVIQRFGPVVYSGFGMTELGANVLSHPKSAHVRALNGEEHLLASCGKPMCLVEVMVADEAGAECEIGQVGEIWVKGAQVLIGYFANEEGTADAFSEEWFRTGDLAKRDDEGFIYIVDRLKDMILTGGENVYSREVEEVIYAHPGVVEAAVIGIADPKWGEKVVAVVVLQVGHSADAPRAPEVIEVEIVELCRSRLAGYKVPRQLLFVDELPKTTSGKILKRQLGSQF